MPGKIKQIEPLIAYLDDDVFHGMAFAGQTQNLFAAESAALMQKMRSILTKSFSVENLDFLCNLYEINEKKNLSITQMQMELKKLDKEFISTDAATPLNINEATLLKIRAKTHHVLTDYKNAIREVFDLISMNVTSHTKQLGLLDQTIHLKNQALILVDALGQTIKLDNKLPPILKSLGNSEQEKLFLDCQTACKIAQKELMNLLSSNVVDIAASKKQFNTIFMTLLNKLSAGFKDLQHLEVQNPKLPKKASFIYNLIQEANNIARTANEDQKIRSKKNVGADSENSSSNGLSRTVTNISEMGTRSHSISTNPLNPNASPRIDYKPSSRATSQDPAASDEQIINNRPKR
jgi:hypothetical protein